jgi:hypothetical protein
MNFKTTKSAALEPKASDACQGDAAIGWQGAAMVLAANLMC